MRIESIKNEITALLQNKSFENPVIKISRNLNDQSLFFFNNLVLRYEEDKNRILLKSSYKDLIPSHIHYTQIKSMPEFIRIPIDLSFQINDLTQFFVHIYQKSFPPQTYGCCNSFTICSDLKKCVMKDPIMKHECMYKENLDNGRIFYGKNKNI